MPEFSFDLSDYAKEWVKLSIKDMPGNPGQEVLVNELDIDCTSVMTVYIAGRDIDVECKGDIRLTSNHPEAIEIIIEKGKESFEFFNENIADIFTRTRLIGVRLNPSIIDDIRDQKIDEAFRSL